MTLPVVLITKFLTSDSVRDLIIRMLEIYVEKTDNTLDDQVLKIIKEMLINTKG